MAFTFEIQMMIGLRLLPGNDHFIKHFVDYFLFHVLFFLFFKKMLLAFILKLKEQLLFAQLDSGCDSCPMYCSSLSLIQFSFVLSFLLFATCSGSFIYSCVFFLFFLIVLCCFLGCVAVHSFFLLLFFVFVFNIYTEN